MTFDINRQLLRKPALIVKKGDAIERVEFLRYIHVAHVYTTGRYARNKAKAA